MDAQDARQREEEEEMHAAAKYADAAVPHMNVPSNGKRALVSGITGACGLGWDGGRTRRPRQPRTARATAYATLVQGAG
jgi:hypothetical protein